MNIAPNDTHIDSSNLQERFGTATVELLSALHDELQYYDSKGMYTRDRILESIFARLTTDMAAIEALFDVLGATGILPYVVVGEMSCGTPLYRIKPEVLEEAA